MIKATAVRAFTTLPGTIKENRAALSPGSVLDPLNHPSYSDDRYQTLLDNHEAFFYGIKELKVRYSIP